MHPISCGVPAGGGTGHDYRTVVTQEAPKLCDRQRRRLQSHNLVLVVCVHGLQRYPEGRGKVRSGSASREKFGLS